MFKYAIAAVLAGVAVSFVGCSSDDGKDNQGSSGGDGGSGAIAVTGGTGAVGTGGTVGSGGTGGSWNSPITITEQNGQCILSDNDTGCVGESYAPEIIPLDIYIMFDQSGSTCTCVDPPATGPAACPPPNCNATRLDAIRQAATQFLQDPDSAGIGVGIGYFGYMQIGSTSCNPADYDDPTVGIAELPGNADPIIQSLNALEPTGETPSAAAIRGACTYASQWKSSNPSHEVVILLLTDGKPEAPVTCPNLGTCCPTLEDTVAAATECRDGTPSVKTYVLGVGPLTGNLDAIADAGGTTQAYHVDDVNASQTVLDALRAIRGDAIIPCDLQLPPPPAGSALNTNEVNIAYADSACEGTVIGHVDTLATCDNTGGWYYDDPANPQAIHLCPTTCDMVSDPGGSLLFSVGCRTVTVPR